MWPIAETETFCKNTEFVPEIQGARCFLKKKSPCARVETDELGLKVFDMLPASLKEIKANLLEQEKQGVSKTLLAGYLSVFSAGGLIVRQESAAVTKPDCRHHAKGCISVIIVSYNGEDYIRNNLDSLFSQTRLPAEVIVVDNNSSDNTVKIIEEYGEKVTLIRNRKNLHYARGVNMGVRAARGELLAILNQDIICDEKFLEGLENTAAEYCASGEIAAIVPQIRFQHLPGFINSIGNIVRNHGWGSDNYFCVADIGQLEKICLIGSSCFGAICVTRKGWEKTGALDERFGSYYEDVDWSFRAHQAGLKLVFAQNSRVFHKFGGSYNSRVRVGFAVRNRLRFVLKNFSGRIMLGFAKNYMREDLHNFMALFRQCRFAWAGTYVLAYLKLLLHVPGILLYHFKGKSAAPEKIHSYFRCGEPAVILANEFQEPVVTTPVIRSYYLHHV